MTPHELATRIKLLPCRCCGAAPYKTTSYVVCSKDGCFVYGPIKDPTGEKWNALMAPASQPAEPPEGTVRVRIAAEIDEKGNWCAVGWSSASDEDMKESVASMESTDDTRVTVFVTADLPLPKPIEVQGVVE